MYFLKHLSVIIPTYNRSEDLKETLLSFKENWAELNEILIIDQSKDNKTSILIDSLKNKKIKCIRAKIPSLTKARNLGVEKVSKETKLICFLDDDVTLDKAYFENILDVFNKNNLTKGVSGYFLPRELKKVNLFENVIKRIFRIECFEENKMRVLSAYGATYPHTLTKIIDTQWLSGFNMVFKKKICKEFSFDEKLTRYALGEDFDFTYRINKKYPGSLILTPKAKLVHRASLAERMPTEKLAYMNQINHFYFNYKNFNSNIKEKTIFIWCLTGITILRALLILKKRRIVEWLKLKLFIKSLIYTIRNLAEIRRGNLVPLYKN